MTRLAAVTASLAFAGCGNAINRSGNGGPVEKSDLSLPGFQFEDDGGPVASDDAGQNSGEPDICGDLIPDSDCHVGEYGPPSGPFSLQTDQNKNPLERDNGVSRDGNGWLKLDSTHSAFNYLWIANAGEGTTSKIDSKTVREVARYSTVTCFSLKGGSKDACDGNNGCCAVDDWNRYQARKIKQQQPAHQAIQKTNNSPSRTSIDFNGDLFISNRAFGGQSSVTHIANDVASCIDRNHNGRIDTSKDTNGDGMIDKDCNANGSPDDVDDVKGKACNNGLQQEYYGLDDECILWTSNTFPNNATGRPLGLAAGANDANVSDAWAGSYNNGNFVRIDGASGLDKDDTQLPGGCNPYGLAVDASGIGWAPDLGGGELCFFNTKNTKEVGQARDPQFGKMAGYGVTLDRDQNVWVGSGVERYTPDRSNGFKNLNNGWWVKITGASGIGIAADSRTAKDYWVWSCSGGGVLGIPASTIPNMKMDQQIAPNGWPRITMGCYGVGVDSDQNVWGVTSSTVTRAIIDKNGMPMQPMAGAPMGNNKCPAGDTCPLNAGAYTYSDFTGFGLRNFTRPTGAYSVVVPGCVDTGSGQVQDTQWFSVVWDADVPPNTSLTVHARSANSPDLNDAAWSRNEYTTAVGQSPLLLQDNLIPNLAPGDLQTTANDGYLQVEFLFKTQSQNATPKLKSFSVGFKCARIPG